MRARVYRELFSVHINIGIEIQITFDYPMDFETHRIADVFINRFTVLFDHCVDCPEEDGMTA